MARREKFAHVLNTLGGKKHLMLTTQNIQIKRYDINNKIETVWHDRIYKI